MKIFSKLAALALISSALASTALATTPAYTSIQPFTKANKPAATQVSVVNNTVYDYTSYASYLPSNVIWNTYLGPYGANTDEIYYGYGVPNYCFNIVRNFDGLIVYYGCLQTGTVNINPYAGAKLANGEAGLPTIKISK